MLPIKLIFKGFESYQQEQIIDFRAFEERGIFLICGDTGAGKTAILDAITYALYGETSGGERTYVRNSITEDETRVDFTFQIKDKTYRFVRKITPKKRAKDKLDITAECYLSTSENPEFTPILERFTPTAVRKTAEEILGLSIEDFRRVTILPQGKFEEFLTCNSADKERMLTRIFGDNIYLQIGENLTKRANAEKLNLRDMETQLKTILSGENCKDFGELEGRLLESETNLIAAQNEHSKEVENLENLQKNYADLQGIYQRFTELNQWETAYSELMKTRDDIENKKVIMGNHQLGMSLLSLLKNAESTRVSLKKRLENHNSLLKNLENLTAQKSEFQEELSTLDSLISQKQTAENRLNNLAEMVKNLERLSLEEDRLNALEKSEISLKKLISDTEKSGSKSTDEREKITAEIEEIREKQLNRLPVIKEILQRLTEEKTILKSLAQLQKNRDDLTAEIAHSKGNLSDLQRRLDEAQGELLTVKKEYYKGVGAEISANLEDGEICPVCGNIHRKREIDFAEKFTTKSDISNGERVVNDLIRAVASLESKVESLDEKLESIQGEIEIARGKSENISYSEGYENEILGEHSQIVKLAENVPMLMKRQAEIDSDLSRKITILEENKIELNRINAEKSQCLGACGLLREQLTGDISLADLTAEMAEQKAHYNSISSRIEKINERQGFFEKEETILTTDIATSEREIIAVREENAIAENALSTGISENNLSGEGQIRELIIPDEILVEITLEIGEFGEKSAILSNKIITLKEELSQKDMPKKETLEELSSAVEGAISRKDESAKNLGRGKLLAKRLEDVKANYLKKQGGYGDKLDEVQRLSQFAEIIHGSKRNSFNRFAMGVLLSVIVDNANEILRDNLGGKFQLTASDQAFGNKKSGLELTVSTPMGSYPVQNLSGGEKFQISLALSQGLSAVVSNRGGRVSTDSLFIDEGFGSLDGDALINALSILKDLNCGKKIIGIISHVKTLQEIIPDRIVVKKGRDGSVVRC